MNSLMWDATKVLEREQHLLEDIEKLSIFMMVSDITNNNCIFWSLKKKVFKYERNNWVKSRSTYGLWRIATTINPNDDMHVGQHISQPKNYFKILT